MATEEKQKLHRKHTLAEKKTYSKESNNPKQTMREVKREKKEGHEQE
jgi:hypothetical protein